MKTTKNLILLASFVAVLSVPGRGQEAGIAKDNKATTADKPNNDGQTRPPAVEAGDRAADNPGAVSPATAPASTSGEAGLRLNFRGVPLDMVLNYLSDAAGFIINLKPGTDVKGKVDVWSNQPLSKDEAVVLLNTVLNQNGFTAVRKERTLTIMSRKDAKTEDIPVRRGNEPKDIR